MTKPEKITWTLFALIIIGLYLFALDIPLLGPDEPRYSQVAREMFERGDWITTTLGGHNWFEKPALLYWLQIAFYNLFGVSEFSARLGSALFGLGIIGSLFILGKYVSVPLTGHSNSGCKTENPELPYWMALISASSIGLIAFSRGASFDIVITFPITAALVSFFIWEIDSSKKKDSFFHPCLLSFYFFIGISLIAKGLIGVVFPIAIVIFYFVLNLKVPNRKFLTSLFWGAIVSAIVAMSWYLPVYLRNGWEFVDEFFIQHHFQRFASNKFQHPQPFWFFWIVLPAMTIPWVPFFLKSIWDFFRDILKNRKPNSASEPRPVKSSRLIIFAFAWMLVPLVFFSLSGSKLPGYILPSLPAASILTAITVSRLVRNSHRRKMAMQFLAFATFLVVAILLQFALPKFAKDDSVNSLIKVATIAGYQSEKILNYQTTSHSLEYYGAGRLVREDNGKQKRFDTVAELNEFMLESDSSSALLLIPEQFVKDFSDALPLELSVLDKNAEYAIGIVKRK